MFASSTNRPLALATGDRLRRAWVLFPTGLGKSALLANLIVQDAVRRSLHEALSLLIDPIPPMHRSTQGHKPDARASGVREDLGVPLKEPCLHKEAGFRRASFGRLGGV
jgi:hypothetical protein